MRASPKFARVVLQKHPAAPDLAHACACRRPTTTCRHQSKLDDSRLPADLWVPTFVTMSDQLLSPTSIHPALSNPAAFPPLQKSEESKTNNNHNTLHDRPRTSSSTSSGPTLTTSIPYPPTLQQLSLDEAKHNLRYVDHNQPISLSAALVGGDSEDSDPSPYAKGHRKGSRSIESIPRQTLFKALASSVSRNNKPEALSLPGMLSASQPSGPDARRGTSSSQLCDALNDLAQRTHTPTTAFPALQSPCFYHQRFDGIVDIDRVLEEIKNDEWMSHSRLVQTATGVREVSKQLQRRPIKRAVRNVMIVTKARDNQLVVLTRELAQWLLSTPRYGSDLGVNVYVDAKLRNSKRFNAQGLVNENPRFQHMLKYWTPDLCWSQPEKFDLVLTLGGDGTVLFTSWLFQRIVPPVLSFSLGSLGFLTPFGYDHFKEHLSRVMGDDGMKINLRMRFTCTVYRDGQQGRDLEEGEQFEVLNELVIDRGPSPYVSNLELYGDNELLTVVQADGCIFSTPTGRFSLFDRSSLMSCIANLLHRIDRLFSLRRWLPCPPRPACHPPHTYLPAHTFFPAHGPIRYDALASDCPSQLASNSILCLRRQGTRGTQARRLCHHHGLAVPFPHRKPHRHRMVRLRLPDAALEHPSGDTEGLRHRQRQR